MEKTVKLILEESKKHSGKYVVDGTQGDTYPKYHYIPKEWFNGKLPPNVEMTVREV